ncbi:hypothetical protein ACTJJN_26635, partial [Pseudomonas sp. 22515]
AGPAGQLPPAVHRCCRHRIRGQARSYKHTRIRGWAQVVVGAGSPAKGPGLLANFHRPFTVAAATVFAGKPAPTHTRIGGSAQVVVGAGLPANRPSGPVQKNQIFSVCPLKAFPSAISFEYAMPKPGRVMTYLLNLRSL